MMQIGPQLMPALVRSVMCHLWLVYRFGVDYGVVSRDLSFVQICSYSYAADAVGVEYGGVVSNDSSFVQICSESHAADAIK